MIILYGSQQGGCDKSAGTDNLCVELAANGLDFVLVDADIQSPCARWASGRKENEHTPIDPCIKEYGNLHNSLLDLNPNLKIYGLISMGPTHYRNSEMSEAREHLTDFPEITPLKSVIYDRKAYRDAMSEGLGVIELCVDKAKSEVKALREELISW